MEIIDTYDLVRINISELRDACNVWAIYGTGNGAEMVWSVINELGCADRIACVLDNADIASRNVKFHEYKVCSVEERINELNIIIIGAELNHFVLKEHLTNYFYSKGIKNILVVDPFQFSYDNNDEKEYIQYLGLFDRYENKDFVRISEDNYTREDEDTKVIAWYLPQFHQMDINNEYHGQGFTEWTNTSRMSPQFIGHYQPHVPYDVGYYDLMNPETMNRQIFLAKKYGIYGFGFFYYWFSGKRLMEKPLQLFLEHKELNIPFCLHWVANSWSKSWYGESDKVILRQEGLNALEFWKDIYPYFMDERYIKIDGKPVFVLYECLIFGKEEFKNFISKMRSLAKDNGFIDLYIMISTGGGAFEDAEEWGGDALVEYQPWKFYQSPSIKSVLPKGYINPNFRATLKDLSEAILKKEYLCPHSCKKYFRSALALWDNAARKKESNAIVMLGNTPERMREWLIDIISENKKSHSQQENIIFISSWNEWAEGSHLEPDYRYGYAWLEAVRKAVEFCRKV